METRQPLPLPLPHPVTGVDVRDMVMAHRAFRREFRLAPAAVRRTTPGDRRHARRVAAHLRGLTRALHHHHDGEDRLLWPRLHARVPHEPGRTVAVMEDQHEAIAALLASAAAELPLVVLLEDLHWADPASADVLAHLAVRLHDEPVAVGLSVLVLVALALIDHPALYPRTARREITLDGTFPDEARAAAEVEQLTGAHVVDANVLAVDYVRELTRLRVRVALPAGAPAPEPEEVPA
jgi:hypothetical protein